MGLVDRTPRTKAIGGRPPLRLVALGYSFRRQPKLGRTVDDVVIDVRDVGNVVHLEAGPLEVATDEIPGDHGSTMADVREVVDGRPAAVHRELPRRAGNHLDDLALRGVIELQHETRLPAGHRGSASISVSGSPRPRSPPPAGRPGSARHRRSRGHRPPWCDPPNSAP